MKVNNIIAKSFIGVVALAMMTGCKDDFLDADPQSIFVPEKIGRAHV